MTKSLILGTILGGLAAFVWSSISWELIGWHEKTMVAFHNEDEVSAVIASHAGQDGTFILPGVPSTAGMTPEQKKAALDAVMQKMQTGPIMVAAVRRGGFGSYTHGLIVQLLSLMAAAFLLTWLLLQTYRPELRAQGRVSGGCRPCRPASSLTSPIGIGGASPAPTPP